MKTYSLHWFSSCSNVHTVLLMYVLSVSTYLCPSFCYSKAHIDIVDYIIKHDDESKSSKNDEE